MTLAVSFYSEFVSVEMMASSDQRHSSSVAIVIDNNESERHQQVASVPSAGAEAPTAPEVHFVKQADFETLTREREVWLEQRGWSESRFVQISPDYLTYPVSTLETLARDGDWLAISLLATHLEPKDPVGALNWYRELALLGSTFSITSIVDLYERSAAALVSEPPTDGASFRASSLNMDPEQAQSAALAWALVADLRGDPNGQIMALELGDRFTLSPELVEGACTKALDIIETINASRSSRLIPPLDNSPPPMNAFPYQPGALCPAWPQKAVTCTPVTLGDESTSGTSYRCF